ncbi:hypothetical protein TNCV_3002241 [Trichonephila clavipes]|nr:hypothetical protein TNCV_3002241 [Trichonephila clavipes]
MVNLNREAVQRILTDELHLRKICVKVALKVLSDDQKQYRKDVCVDMLEHIANYPIFLESDVPILPQLRGSGTNGKSPEKLSKPVVPKLLPAIESSPKPKRLGSNQQPSALRLKVTDGWCWPTPCCVGILVEEEEAWPQVERFRGIESVADRKRSGRASIVKTKVAKCENLFTKKSIEKTVRLHEHPYGIHISAESDEKYACLQQDDAMCRKSRISSTVRHDMRFTLPTVFRVPVRWLCYSCTHSDAITYIHFSFG